MGRVVVVGSTNTDMTVQVPHIPRPGETVLGGEFYMAGGGKGANQAVSAARTGADVSFVGRTGDDLFGRDTRQRLTDEGIDLTHLFRSSDSASGVALIVVDDDGENAISVAPGANSQLTPEDVEAAESEIAQADVLVAQLEIPLETVARALELAHDHDVTTVLDPAPARDLDDSLLSLVSILTPNRGEAADLTNIDTGDELGVENAASRLVERGVGTALVTLGADGVFVDSPEGQFLTSGHEVEPVDATAAGDVFSGALASALSENWDLQRAVDFANEAAALSVTTAGAQSSAPYRDDLMNRPNTG